MVRGMWTGRDVRPRHAIHQKNVIDVARVRLEEDLLLSEKELQRVRRLLAEKERELYGVVRELGDYKLRLQRTQQELDELRDGWSGEGNTGGADMQWGGMMDETG